MFRVWIASLALHMGGLLPLRVLQWLGATGGYLLWWTRGRTAQVSLENILLAFPELTGPEQKRLARRSVVETGRTILETAFAWTVSTRRCEQAFAAVEGKAEVDQALKSGSGVIFVIPHLGNWELINHFLGKHYGLIHMYRPHRNQHMEVLVARCRSRTGTRFVRTDSQGIRAQLATLAKGGTIGAMPDQEPDVHTGEFARFVGVPCLTGNLVPRFAARTGAAVFIARCIRLPAGQGFKIQMTPASLGSNPVQALNDAMEHAIRAAPEQYLWSYKRFRTRPPGELPHYGAKHDSLGAAVGVAMIEVGIGFARLFPLETLRNVGKRIGRLLRVSNSSHTRVARTNLGLATPAFPIAASLEAETMAEFGMSVVETARVWSSRNKRNAARIREVHGEDLVSHASGGLLFLTPPLGNRDVMLDYLATRHRLAELYHPNTGISIDNVIRRYRNATGIALMPRTNDSIEALSTVLGRGGRVALCPGQQPRLRDGEFIPFFGEPALTAKAIARLMAVPGTTTVMAVAIRVEDGFAVHLVPVTPVGNANERAILEQVNAKLEDLVRQWPAQYRWQDKRFNIRPVGIPKLYR